MWGEKVLLSLGEASRSGGAGVFIEGLDVFICVDSAGERTLTVRVTAETEVKAWGR